MKIINKFLGMRKANTINNKTLVFNFFIIILAVSSLNLFLMGEGNSTVSVYAQIREQLSIQLFTPLETLKDIGQKKASVTKILNLGDDPDHIQVNFRVPRGQMVQLQVQTRGDFVNEYGNVIPASNIGWQAVGPGFNNGRLSKDSPQLMGSWNGSNCVQGMIEYYYIILPQKKGNYSQFITYTLYTF